MKKSIVILGTGFGGVYTYKCLRSQIDRRTTRLVLVNRTDHFLFSPLLHEVATGGLSSASTIQCVSDIIDGDCASFVKAEIEQIDQDRKIVQTSEGEIAYDQLVLATGATTNFMQVPGAKEHSFPLKSYNDALRLRHRINKIFTDAEQPRHPTLVVVGGGPTGVEVAAELADLFGETLAIVLVHSDKHLLPAFHEKLGQKALQRLKKKGVDVLLNIRVQRVERERVQLSDNRTLPVCGVVWAAGVTPVIPKTTRPLPLTGQRVTVDTFLRVPGFDGLWAVGDIAAAPGEDPGSVAPMRAQAAVHEAHALADNLCAALEGKKLNPYRYHAKGDLVSLGEWYAVGDIAGIRWSGAFAWWLWRTVYLFKFASWSKRFSIALEWTKQLFRPRDVTTS